MEVKAAHMERSAEAGKVTTTFDEEGNDTTAPTVRELGEENEGGRKLSPVWLAFSLSFLSFLFWLFLVASSPSSADTWSGVHGIW
jgi:hypothetical protein